MFTRAGPTQVQRRWRVFKAIPVVLAIAVALVYKAVLSVLSVVVPIKSHSEETLRTVGGGSFRPSYNHQRSIVFTRRDSEIAAAAMLY